MPLQDTHPTPAFGGFGLRNARDRGVHRLLTNPQNLDLIAKSVSEGSWPDSRREMFDQACRLLIRESNGEHLAASPSSADTSLLLEAAGRLCAVQLISGATGYTLPDRAEPDDDLPSFTDVYGDVGDANARNVLGTRIFEGVSEGRLAPVHRQIAEFLAAQYVSSLVDKGLPLERILALITGFDGELLHSFSNFVSWLAVHNKKSRNRLSQLNPVGLIYAGERQTYSADEKREIVRNLRRESGWNPWTSRSRGWAPGIGGIVSPELEDTFRGILTDGKRGQEHQSYMMLLMQMLADGEPLPALSDVLEEIVRDPTWNQGVRCAALDALINYHAGGCLGADTLERLVAEVENGSLEDPHDQLLGILLMALYPNVMTMAEIQQYLREPKLEGTSSEYARFWTDHVLRESTPQQLAELLDGIAERFEEYRPFMVAYVSGFAPLGQLPLELLEKVLRDPDSSVDTGRLYEWLGVVSDLRLPEGRTASIRFDLEWDRDALKDLIAYGVETCLQRDDKCTDTIRRRLFGARPRDYGRWCLEMSLAADDVKVASFYLQELFDCVMDNRVAGGLTMEEARSGLAADEALVNQFDEMVERRSRVENRKVPRTPPDQGTSADSAEDTAEQLDLQAQIEAQATELRAGRGEPELLHRAAEAYLRIDDNSAGKTPRQRLVDLVGGRDDLIDLLLAGMKGTIVREDLPGCDETVRQFDEGLVHVLVLPFVAGLHSLEQSGRLSAGNMSESQTRLAVTILYTLPRIFDPDGSTGTGMHRPEWFRTVLRDSPELVADVVQRSAVLKLATGVQQVIELRELANAEDHREVAELISLPLLEQLPEAETDKALRAHCWALNAALKRCDWSDVERSIGERLERSDQGARERGCWLTAGYLLAPERYREDLRRLIEDEDALKSLPMFMGTGSFPPVFKRRLAQRVVADDFGMLVSALRRNKMTENVFWFMTDLILTLGDQPSAVATEAIGALASMPDAEPWETAIADAKERQTRRRREQGYRHSDIERVVQVLDRLVPANVGDLAALVFDELKALSYKIRDGGTSDWRQHWNVDGYNRPKSPKPEDGCRDALLSDLQERLGLLDIDAQPEGVYADNKRSDIRVSFAGFNVPVEIKRSCHADVWTAVHSQLIAKYTRDPGAAGYGIYLVLWFGDAEKCRPTKSEGWSPETAEAVRLRIEQSLDDRERHLISVCVVDVAAPKEQGS